MKNLVKSAKFTITIPPAKIAETDHLLKNGDFAYRGFAWTIPNPGMGRILNEKTFTGDYSLRIKDDSSKSGSDILSAKITLKKPG